MDTNSHGPGRIDRCLARLDGALLKLKKEKLQPEELTVEVCQTTHPPKSKNAEPLPLHRSSSSKSS